MEEETSSSYWEDTDPEYLEDGYEDVNAKNEFGATKLHIACFHNDHIQAEKLLSKGANPNAQDNNLSTPLHLCAYKGNLELMILLLEAGGDLKLADKKHIKPIHLAGLSKNAQLVKFILEKYKDDNRVYSSPSEEQVHHLAAYCGYDNVLEEVLKSGLMNKYVMDRVITPLHLAAASNNLSTVKLLLDYNSKCNKNDDFRRKPIHWAAYNGNIEMVKLLLEANNSVRNSEDADKNTPLALATMYSHFDVVLYLLEIDCYIHLGSGIRYNNFELTTLTTPDDFMRMNFRKLGKLVNALHWAVAFCSLNIVKDFLNNDFDTAFDHLGNSPLHTACSFGKIDVIEYLMFNHPNYSDLVNNKGETAMNWASAHGYLDIVKYLVSCGVNKKMSLSWAAANGHLDIVEFLLNAGADHEETDNGLRYQTRPIIWAAISKHGNIIDYLLRKFGKRIQTRELLIWCAYNELHVQVRRLVRCKRRINQYDSHYQRTALHWVAFNGNFQIAKLLIDHGANINIRDQGSETPFHLAIRNNKIDIVKLLLEEGMPVNTIGNPQAPAYPLAQAVCTGNLNLVKLLRKYGASANVSIKPQYLPLNCAVKQGFKDIEEYLLTQTANRSSYLHTIVQAGIIANVKKIVESGANINEVNDEGLTPLLKAVSCGYCDITEFLLSKGADVNFGNGGTPLHWAARVDAVDCAISLLKYGADVNVKCGITDSPLSYSIWNKSKKLFKTLLDYKADTEFTYLNGETTLFLACTIDDIYFLQTLVAYNANLYAKNEEGLTLLHKAVRNPDLSFLNYLLTTDLDINVTSNVDFTPLSYAAFHNKREHLHTLILMGADVNLDRKILRYCYTNATFRTVELLVNAGLNLRRVEAPINSLLTEKVLNYMQHSKKNPLSLLQLSRNKCRVVFGKLYKTVIETERLPQDLKGYLEYKI